MMLTAVLMTMSVSARADLLLGRGYSIGFSTTLNDTYVVGAYDAYNKQAVAGYGKELFPIKRNGVEFAYISAYHLFNASEEGSGAFGGALGVKASKLADTLQWCLDKATGFGVKIPDPVYKLSNFVSIEGGYSYRAFGAPQDASPHVLTIGGQIRMPIGDFFAVFGNKK
jgi:hypothetical protein